MLLQVVLHARLAEDLPEDERWSVDDVAGGLVDKMVRRNPHVFAGETVGSVDEIVDELGADQARREVPRLGAGRDRAVPAGARPGREVPAQGPAGRHRRAAARRRRPRRPAVAGRRRASGEDAEAALRRAALAYADAVRDRRAGRRSCRPAEWSVRGRGPRPTVSTPRVCPMPGSAPAMIAAVDERRDRHHADDHPGPLDAEALEPDEPGDERHDRHEHGEVGRAPAPRSRSAAAQPAASPRTSPPPSSSGTANALLYAATRTGAEAGQHGGGEQRERDLAGQRPGSGEQPDRVGPAGALHERGAGDHDRRPRRPGGSSAGRRAASARAAPARAAPRR